MTWRARFYLLATHYKEKSPAYRRDPVRRVAFVYDDQRRIGNRVVQPGLGQRRERIALRLKLGDELPPKPHCCTRKIHRHSVEVFHGCAIEAQKLLSYSAILQVHQVRVQRATPIAIGGIRLAIT